MQNVQTAKKTEILTKSLGIFIQHELQKVYKYPIHDKHDPNFGLTSDERMRCDVTLIDEMAQRYGDTRLAYELIQNGLSKLNKKLSNGALSVGSIQSLWECEEHAWGEMREGTRDTSNLKKSIGDHLICEPPTGRPYDF
jgi:hypothetical protein